MLTQDHTTDFSLPDLDYDYGDLAPFISPEIMELHHSKHHQTYVNNLNMALEKAHEAQAKGDLEAMISLQQTIRFNGGGHINHSYFWKMLAPKSQGGGALPESGPLLEAIKQQFGSIEQLMDCMNQKSAALQGSGWGWIAYHPHTKRLVITSCPNQDPITMQGLEPLIGFDMWEHAYYLQYKNVRPNYLKNIWEVVNWSFVESRFEEVISN